MIRTTSLNILPDKISHSYNWLYPRLRVIKLDFSRLSCLVDISLESPAFVPAFVPVLMKRHKVATGDVNLQGLKALSVALAHLSPRFMGL
jgi:hypothetical protein